MVMGGLAIALGEVVDDAIIDTENIFRRLRLNRSATRPLPVEDVVLGASVEVRTSVVYATFIVALVFVPLLTLGGVAGKLFAPLGVAYIFAILASLVVARDADPSAVLSASGPRGTEGRRSAVRALAQAPLPAASSRRIERYPGRVIAVTGRGHRRRHRTVAAVFRGIHPGAARRPLHHAHVGRARHFGGGVAAHRQESVGGHRLDRGRAVRGPVGGSLEERRRYLRHALQRIRGRDRRAAGQGSGSASCARSATRCPAGAAARSRA